MHFTLLYTLCMLSSGTPVQQQDKETGSVQAYELVERAGAEYEQIDQLQEQSDMRREPDPHDGEYELVKCASEYMSKQDNN